MAATRYGRQITMFKSRNTPILDVSLGAVYPLPSLLLNDILKIPWACLHLPDKLVGR